MRLHRPESGDIKIKKKFALFPVTIGKETRWLEWVTIQYIFSDWDIHIDWGRAYRTYGWEKEKFIDDDTD